MDESSMTETIIKIMESSVLALVVWFLLQKIERQMRNQNLIQIEFMKAFISHDAQVRGVNPALGEDIQRLEEAKRSYDQVRESLDRLVNQIEKS